MAVSGLKEKRSKRRRDGRLQERCSKGSENLLQSKKQRGKMQSIRLVNSTARGGSEFGRSVSGCPGGGRGLADFPISRIAALTPTVWATRN
jgi:hypothetical protein